jgi:hypothetical protein
VASHVAWRGLGLGLAALLGITAQAWAVDGVIEINQTRVLAGAVTPGDMPGFPVTIDQPGSYRLTGNLTVPNENTTAIQITAEGVTLDLNGFVIQGPSVQAGPNGSGIGVQGPSSTVVMNGTIHGMGSHGVSLGSRSRAENLQLYFNLNGFNGGVDSIVVNVISGRNRQHGIFVAGDSTVTRCVANDNLMDGIQTFDRSTVIGNTATDNGNYGINCGDNSLVLQNTASRNVFFGMSVPTGSGYGQNIVNDNHGGNNNPQVANVNGAFQIGINVCGGDTTCP